MKKVLIITYYWIPSGGAGVQRWVKFTKYLRDFAWEPIIYTPENPEYPVIDKSFENDIPSDIVVLKQPIWEPYDIYRKLTGKKNEAIKAGFISEKKAQSWKDKLSIWIRGNFLIPDPRRFWIKPSIHYLTNYLNDNPVDAIITTGPPHSMHMIGLGLKKRFPNLTWIADFRDPWTKIYYHKDLKLTKLSNKIHHDLEKKIVQSADAMVVVSKGMESDFLKLSPKKLKIITNGFDENDFPKEKIELNKKFAISYIGLLTKYQNPETLWKVLSELCSENSEFSEDLQLVFAGNRDNSVDKSLQNYNLNKYITEHGYVSHDKAIELQRSTQVLLLLLINDKETAKGVLTGKFFEYIAANRPILAIGSTESNIAEILTETQAGKIADYDDAELTKKIILEYYKQYKNANLKIESSSTKQFSRRNLTFQLTELLTETSIY